MSLLQPILLYGMETQITNKRDRNKLEAAQMKLIRKLMRSQAMLTKESNNILRARVNINTIETETQVRRLNIIIRAAKSEKQQAQIKAALIGQYHQKPQATQHTKRGIHAIIGRDIISLITKAKGDEEIIDIIKSKGITEKVWDYIKQITGAQVTQLRSTQMEEGTSKRQQEAQPVNCPICNKTFDDNTRLAAHKLRAHKQGNKYREAITTNVCIHCKKEFKNIENAKQHFTRICKPKLTQEQLDRLLKRYHPAVPQLTRAFQAGMQFQ